MAALFAVLLLVTLTSLIRQSNGFYLNDEGAHFVSDATAFQRPSLSIGVWQRFGSVWLFAVPAQFGRTAVEVFAALIFLSTIAVTYKVAELEQLPGKEWIIALTAFQPAFLDIGYTCLSELPAAFLLILSYYWYRRSRWNLSLLAASLVFLFRYEMFFFALIIFFLAWKNRRFDALPWILTGPAVWWIFSLIWTGDLLWLPREILRYGRLAKYKEGTTILHYVNLSPDIFGWVPVIFFVVSLAAGAIRKSVTVPVAFLTVVLNLLICTLASGKDFNWTGAVGDIRYLTPVSPFVALIALHGLSSVGRMVPLRGAQLVIPLALCSWLYLQCVSNVEPHRLSPYEHAVIGLTDKAASDTASVPILSNHWASQYAVLIGTAGNRPIVRLSRDTFDSCKTAYVLWDPQLANSPFTYNPLTLDDLNSDRRVRKVDSLLLGDSQFYLFLKQ